MNWLWLLVIVLAIAAVFMLKKRGEQSHPRRAVPGRGTAPPLEEPDEPPEHRDESENADIYEYEQFRSER